MGITSIVLTGGPCAGKSTGVAILEQSLTEKGYKVFIVPETATEIINAGANYKDFDPFEFQKAIFVLQATKEKVFMKLAKEYEKTHNKNCIILYDRGLIDMKAYIGDEKYRELAKLYNKTETEIRDKYDGVIHLKTAADGAIEYYTCSNNNARTETPEEAVELDKACIHAWTGHPHFRVIDNSTDFTDKLRRLVKEVYSILGEPVPVEMERKYLIKMPNIDELKKHYDITKVNIIQTYLVSKDGAEHRIRQRGIDEEFSYFYTEKIGKGLSRIEKEKKITPTEYLRYLMQADTTLNQIRKDRYCFICNNNYIELDIYPFWSEHAIIEVEVTEENEKISLPPEIEVINEVTEDDRFKNISLAKNPFIKGIY